MTYPTMTLKEFNEYMQEGHYQYSLFIILQLDEAMEYLKKAQQADADMKKFWYQWAYVTLVDALETAESEYYGETSAYLPTKETDPVTRAYCQNTYDIWRGYSEKAKREFTQNKNFEEAKA
ncbi:MAG: HEPN domain-containing protein [Lacticaseibacillus casei]